MKKIILLLAFIACISTASANVYGDVNGDGKVTATDVTAIYNVLLGTDNTYAATADVNGDHSVTSVDVTIVYDILLNGSTPQPKRGKIYICDNANWGDMALYAWPEQGLSTWPGIHHNGTVSREGKNYYEFDLTDGYYSRALNYIANNYAAVNGGTSRQLDLMSDYTMGENDIYLTISGSAGNYSYVIDDDGTPPPVVYLHSDLGWNDYYLYVWKNAAPVSASWPGEHYTSTKTIDGELWYAYELPKVYYTTNGTNWILNNNSGNQYDLMQGFAYSQDIYMGIGSSGKFFDGSGWEPGPGFVAVERPWYTGTMEKDTESILGGIKDQFAIEFKDEHEKYNASISMGSYVKSFEGEGFDTIFYGADKALYISKQTGRDRYTFYQEKKDSEE